MKKKKNYTVMIWFLRKMFRWRNITPLREIELKAYIEHIFPDETKFVKFGNQVLEWGRLTDLRRIKVYELIRWYEEKDD